MPKTPPDLPRLLPTSDPNDRVQVQQSAFSHDILGRYVCNDWDEVQAAIDDGGFPFDAVVIGAGMFGAYCAAKLFWRGGSKALRILVLDAGAFLLPTHIQNLPQRLGGTVGGPMYDRTRDDQTHTQNVIWGMPWISNTPFPGLAYCLGGRSLFFGGWSPRLTSQDLKKWPKNMRKYLEGDAVTTSAYERIETEIGTAQTTDYIVNNTFHDDFKTALEKVGPSVNTVTGVEEAPLAVQASAPGPGLFPFDKFSTGPFFIDAVRADAAGNFPTYGDRGRRLFIVPRTHVTSLDTSGRTVTRINFDANGTTRFLDIDPSCAVILANGTIEASRLALESLGVGNKQFGSPRVGNLMAHLRSNIVVRIRRTALGLKAGAPAELETTAFLVRGDSRNRRYHLQVTAGAVGTADSEKNLWQQVPDIDLQDQMRANQDPDWITITFRGIGEMEDSQTLSPKPEENWIDLSPTEFDENARRRAYVNLKPSTNDGLLWTDMDDATFELAAKLASKPADIQYWNKDTNQWQNTRPQPRPDGTKFWQDSIGSTHHEAGTLFMGDDPANSITDLDGKFHGFDNAYVAGPATFPTLGSANPSLTALTLARRTAGAIVRGATPPLPAGFTALSLDPADWKMVGRGGNPRIQRFGEVWETLDGYGLYWYTKEQFDNFTLCVDWRVARFVDNSGVYIRTPGPNVADPLGDADTKGHEVQIDEFGAPSRAGTSRTGAIYGLQAPSSFPSAAVGRWNRYLITAKNDQITVNLNGQDVNQYTSTRQQTGFIALQVHDFGSRVQFRNLGVKKL